MNDFEDDYERPGAGEGLRYRDKSNDRKTGPRDSIGAGLLVALVIAILIAWNAADGGGYDHTVQCVAPQVNCG